MNMDEFTLKEEIKTWIRDSIQFNNYRPATTLEKRAKKILRDCLDQMDENDGINKD